MADDGWGLAAEEPKVVKQEPAWDIKGLKDALPNGTNGVNGANGNAANGTNASEGASGAENAVDEEKATVSEQAKARGWVPPTAYDYASFQGTQDTDWEGNARVYEWDGEHGDIGPELPELELELFGDPNTRATVGLDFSK
jgi:ATP-dependent RNA helicase DDX3X